MIDIGLILKGLREDNSYTQAKLAKRLGVSITTIASWESGMKFPTIDRLIVLAKLYSVPLDFIVGINREKSIILDDLTQQQKNLLKTLILEFQSKGISPPGLTDRQKDILSDLLAEFSK